MMVISKTSKARPIRTLMRLVFAMCLLGVSSCSTNPPMKTVPYVDLDRFMGDWFVVASIPTFFEKQAFNAVESYELTEQGHIATTFTFNKSSFEGTLKKYEPMGYVVDEKTNASWGMQFIWPIKADYRIVYLDEDYTQTVIAREKRDYVWIMTREPFLSAQDLAKFSEFISELGYDAAKLRLVPHKYELSEVSTETQNEPRGIWL